MPFKILAVCLAFTLDAAAANPAREAAIDGLLARAADTPGADCALGVLQHGAFDYQRATPAAALDRTFPLASLSKQFTAAAIVLLAQEGRLRFDDDIRRYLPELPDFGAPIRIRHLLHHTSGLHDYTGLTVIGGRRASEATSDADIMAFVRRQASLDFTPGSDYSYSNTGYFLLARIVERVSGQDYGSFLKQRLFAPLGMRDSFVGSAPGNAWTETGARGVFTTLRDLGTWAANLESPRLGGRDLVQTLQTHGHLDDGTPIDYAMGLRQGRYRGWDLIEHGGSDQGDKAEFLRVPAAGLSVLARCHGARTDMERLALDVADRYLATDAAPAAPAAADPASASLAGTYWSRTRGILRRLVFDQGQLWFERSPRSRQALRPDGPGRFHTTDDIGQSELQALAPRRLRLETPSARAVEFEPVAPPAAVRGDDYAGAFYNQDYDATWRISTSGGGLAWRRAKDAPDAWHVLQPIAADVFGAPGFILRFERGPDGQVQRMALDTERPRQLRFEKTAP